MSLVQWVRRTSEHYLMVDAMDKVGRKFGANTPTSAHGASRSSGGASTCRSSTACPRGCATA